MVRNYRPRNMKTHECVVCGKLWKPQRNGAIYCRERCRKAASREYPIGPIPASLDTLRAVWKRLSCDQAEQIDAAAFIDLATDASAPAWVMRHAHEMMLAVSTWHLNSPRYVCCIRGIVAAKMREWLRM